MTDLDVDLFAGAGGASTGLASLGLDPVGFDRDADAVASHHAAGHRTVRADLATYPWGHLRGRVRLLHGSPPCQPFSSHGDRSGQDDARDGMPWTLRAVDGVRPEVATIENVPGLLNRKHRRHFSAVITRLAVLGYRVEYRVLNAADYGVPQARQRLIIVATRHGHVRWPRPTHAEGGARGLLPWVTMADALGWGSTRALFTGTDWREGGSREDAQSRALDRPAPTITAKSGGQWQLRGADTAGPVRVELDELAVLQGFPADYPFAGNRTSIARQVGNAIPPALLAAVVAVNLPDAMAVAA